MADEASVQQAVGLALEACGGLHGAVNWAGIAIVEQSLGKNGPHPLAVAQWRAETNLPQERERSASSDPAPHGEHDGEGREQDG